MPKAVENVGGRCAAFADWGVFWTIPRSRLAYLPANNVRSPLRIDRDITRAAAPRAQAESSSRGAMSTSGPCRRKWLGRCGTAAAVLLNLSATLS